MSFVCTLPSFEANRRVALQSFLLTSECRAILYISNNYKAQCCLLDTNSNTWVQFRAYSMKIGQRLRFIFTVGASGE